MTCAVSVERLLACADVQASRHGLARPHPVLHTLSSARTLTQATGARAHAGTLPEGQECTRNEQCSTQQCADGKCACRFAASVTEACGDCVLSFADTTVQALAALALTLEGVCAACCALQAAGGG
jgi:hypothetical protein